MNLEQVQEQKKSLKAQLQALEDENERLLLEQALAAYRARQHNLEERKVILSKDPKFHEELNKSFDNIRKHLIDFSARVDFATENGITFLPELLSPGDMELLKFKYPYLRSVLRGGSFVTVWNQN